MAKLGAVIAALLIISACGSMTSRGPASSARIPVQPSQPPVPTNSGQIAGTVVYPAGGPVRPQTVYAIATGGSRFFTVETVSGQSTYIMRGVAPGDYFVLTVAPEAPYYSASSSAGTGQVYRFPAGYTKAVACGLSVACNDHTLVSVRVSAGATTGGIDPTDWYGPPNSFPLIPPSGELPIRAGVPVVLTSGSSTSFPDPKQATAYIAAAVTTGRYVTSSDACPINTACVWMTAEQDGQSAAYSTVVAGSNGITQACVIYLVSTSTGWQGLGGDVGIDSVCSPTGAAFPGVDEHGQIQMGLGQTGCVNVHSTPSLSARVVSCLPDGSPVVVDGGPAYVPASPPLPPIDLPSATLDYWWHIAGQGWLVHAYLLTRHYG
jgi:hypothetical protein